MSFPIYRHDKSWDAWVGGADDNDGRWSTVKRPSIWKRRRSDDRRDTRPELETIDALAMTSEPADENADAPERDSFWKRERSFGRRKSADEPQSDDVEPELSWWSRRSDEDQVAAEDPVAQVADSGDLGDEDSSADELAPAAEKQSIWKRELSFGRKAESGNEVAEPVVDAEPEAEATGVEHHVGEVEPSAVDSIAEAEVEEAAVPVGWSPEWPSAAAADSFAESEVPSTESESPTFSWQPAEAPSTVVADVESDWSQTPQAETSADNGPVEEYDVDENADASATPERDSFWKRERSFGRRKSADEPQSDDVEPELSWWSRRSDEDQVAAEDPVAQVADSGDLGDEDSSADELAPAAEKQSIWKRELSFGRKAESGNEVAEPVVDAEPEAEATGVEHHVGEVEPSAVDSIAEAEVEEAAVPVGWSPEWPSAAAADSSTEFEAPSTESESPTFSWQPAEAPSTVVADVESDWSQTPQAETSADNGPVDEYETEAETDERLPGAERQSIWKRELRFGRREARGADDGQLDRAEASQAVHHDELDQPSEAAASGESDVDETQPPVPFAETTLPELDAGTLDVDTLPHDAPAEDTPARPARRRSPLGRNRGPRTPKAPAAEKSSTSPKGGKKLVGLKIGASQIAAAYVHSNGSHEVLKLARTPLERGVVVSGELRDPDALAVALKAFFNENKLPKRNIRLGIASNRVGVRVLDVPGVEDPALLGNAVRFRAQEVLPIPLSEAVLDYRVLRERHDDEGNVIREVLVAFAYRELVDRYAEVCRSAGLRLMGIDLDGFALLRALVDPAASSSRLGGAAVVTVALGHDRSIMSISNGDACEFTRVIDWGGASLDTAVARILALTPSQAEPIKRELTLDNTAPAPEGLAPDQASRARAAMGQEVGAFAREFVSSLQFYQSQPRSLDIGEIVLTGGMAHMAGLAQQLQELIGVTVRIGDPLGRVKLGKQVDTEEAIGSFALAIGLGIED